MDTLNAHILQTESKPEHNTSITIGFNISRFLAHRKRNWKELGFPSSYKHNSRFTLYFIGLDIWDTQGVLDGVSGIPPQSVFFLFILRVYYIPLFHFSGFMSDVRSEQDSTRGGKQRGTGQTGMEGSLKKGAILGPRTMPSQGLFSTTTIPYQPGPHHVGSVDSPVLGRRLPSGLNGGAAHKSRLAKETQIDACGYGLSGPRWVQQRVYRGRGRRKKELGATGERVRKVRRKSKGVFLFWESIITGRLLDDTRANTFEKRWLNKQLGGARNSGWAKGTQGKCMMETFFQDLYSLGILSIPRAWNESMGMVHSAGCFGIG
jgi:hypothetical protein